MVADATEFQKNIIFSSTHLACDLRKLSQKGESVL